MSHEVETMAYAGQVPWHGLGVQVADNMTPDEMLTLAGLNWTVSKRPMNFRTKPNDSTKKVDEHFALVRDSDNKFMDVVGARYTPTQNSEVFSFFDEFVKATQLKMHTAGSLCEGKYVWALAELNRSFEVMGDGDRTDGYILLLSPHQLGKSIIAQQTCVRVVCQNTLNMALRDKSAAFRFQHSRKFDDYAKAEAAEVLGLAVSAFDELKTAANLLSTKKCDAVSARDFFNGIMVRRARPESTGTANDNETDPPLVRRMLEAFNGAAPGQQLASARGTWWGAFNAVTYVMDHNSGKSRDNSVRDNWLGGRGELKRTALAQALKLAA